MVLRDASASKNLAGGASGWAIFHKLLSRRVCASINGDLAHCLRCVLSCPLSNVGFETFIVRLVMVDKA